MRTAHKAASILIAAALTLSVVGCSGGDDKPAAGPTKKAASASATTAAPTPSPTRKEVSTRSTDNPLGLDWGKQPPFTGPAADAFGSDYVMTAYRHAVTFSLQEGYTNLMAKGYEARPVEFSAVKPYMTAGAQKVWDADVKAALAKDRMRGDAVNILTSWNLEGRQDIYTFREGQVMFAMDSKFSPAKASVQTVRGEKFLVLRFNVSRDIRFMKEGKAVLVPLQKDITYRMAPNGLKHIPWLIDAWTILPKGGEPTPDPLGTAS